LAKIPDNLFKFCTAAGALQVLDSESLRWSSPVLYKDPLELDHNSRIGFDREILLQSAIKLASGMIFTADTPHGDTPLINAIKRWRDEGRFATPEEAEGVLKELLTKMVDQRMGAISQTLEDWRHFNRHIRICSFCSRPDNVTAWDQFAEYHRGVCFRFDIHPHSTFNAPKPIVYKEQRPQLADLRENIDTILFNLPQQLTPSFEQLLCIKPPVRRYEQEWRCFRKTSSETVTDDVRTWAENITFNTEELSAVCFGIATPEKVRNAIKKLVEKKFPATRLYQTSLTNGRYELEIQKI